MIKINSKYIIIIIILYLFLKYRKSSMPTFVPDIIISPGGRFGMYNLGICHYIKNNFNIENKKILGFSAGAWNSLFMCLKKEYINCIIKKAFKHKDLKVSQLLNQIKNIVKEYKIEDFNIKNLYIAISHFNNLSIYNKFLTLE